MYLLISKLDHNSPALDTSSFIAIDDEMTTALEEYETTSYFCNGGHSFTLAFEEGVKPVRYFECITCTAIAVDNPTQFSTLANITEISPEVTPQYV